jgi:PD-(D/E)XK endonuclease
VLTPTVKGSIAEAVLAAEAVKAGIMVLRPVVEGRRYDLVFDLGDRMLRVQCKSGRHKGGGVIVHTRTSRHTPQGYVWTTYGPDEIDALGVYCPQIDRCYLLPIDLVAGRSAIHLRLVAAANNQRASIHFAADFAFPGAIAQLGERRAGSAKVGGSNPPSSISIATPLV